MGGTPRLGRKNHRPANSDRCVVLIPFFTLYAPALRHDDYNDPELEHRLAKVPELANRVLRVFVFQVRIAGLGIIKMFWSENN